MATRWVCREAMVLDLDFPANMRKRSWHATLFVVRHEPWEIFRQRVVPLVGGNALEKEVRCCVGDVVYLFGSRAEAPLPCTVRERRDCSAHNQKELA